jgi:ribonuclease P protein subunit POP4
MITPKNLVKHELIGLNVEVIDSSNKSQIGTKGMVVNETKNTLVIKTRKDEKRIQKKGSVLMFKLSKHKVRVNGDKIIARPEDRIKLKVKKW